MQTIQQVSGYTAGLTAESAFQQRLRKEAVQVLQACEENQRADGGTASVTRTGSYAAPVELHGVTVRGFRCFGAEPVTFSFRDAGIVALTGRNDMDVGASPLTLLPPSHTPSPPRA